MDARYDPIARRYTPDPKLVHMAHNARLSYEEQANPAGAYVRQQWDAAFGSTRVALEALRAIWPTERANMPPEDEDHIINALRNLEVAYSHLDQAAEAMVGWAMVAVQRGVITTEEELIGAIGPDESDNDTTPDGEDGQD